MLSVWASALIFRRSVPHCAVDGATLIPRGNGARVEISDCSRQDLLSHEEEYVFGFDITVDQTTGVQTADAIRNIRTEPYPIPWRDVLRLTGDQVLLQVRYGKVEYHARSDSMGPLFLAEEDAQDMRQVRVSPQPRMGQDTQFLYDSREGFVLEIVLSSALSRVKDAFGCLMATTLPPPGCPSVSAFHVVE
jgi:hypothetical protein